jgi:hypothetical protein
MPPLPFHAALRSALLLRIFMIRKLGTFARAALRTTRPRSRARHPPESASPCGPQVLLRRGPTSATASRRARFKFLTKRRTRRRLHNQLFSESCVLWRVTSWSIFRISRPSEAIYRTPYSRSSHPQPSQRPLRNLREYGRKPAIHSPSAGPHHHYCRWKMR